MYDYLIVGAGLFGATFAWCVKESGKSALVIDKRDNIAGNCYTQNIEGVNVHMYGPHAFHTSNDAVWKFVNQHATFESYVHRVRAMCGNHCLSIPINLSTLNSLWGVTTAAEATAELNKRRLNLVNIESAEDWLLSAVGEELYELLFKSYTAKQWRRSPQNLPASIVKRLPIRTTWDDAYSPDIYHGIPTGGYTKFIQSILDDTDVLLCTRFNSDMLRHARHAVYTGEIDKFFDYSLGRLDYLTLQFETKVINIDDYQGIAQMNYCDADVPWTRIVEHKHFERSNRVVGKTVITKETPIDWTDKSEPLYPVNDAKNQALYELYKAEAEKLKNVSFCGRLGSYRYVNMDETVLNALKLAKSHGLVNRFNAAL